MANNNKFKTVDVQNWMMYTSSLYNSTGKYQNSSFHRSTDYKPSEPKRVKYFMIKPMTKVWGNPLPFNGIYAVIFSLFDGFVYCLPQSRLNEFLDFEPLH